MSIAKVVTVVGVSAVFLIRDIACQNGMFVCGIRFYHVLEDKMMNTEFDIEKLSEFQQKAFLFGIDEEIVQGLPADFPVSVEDIEVAFFKAGYDPGEQLLKDALTLWKYRPDRIRRTWG